MADSPFTNEDLETISRTWNSNKYTEHTAMVLAKELLQARAALSHAAGQDGEQCRAASGVEEIARQMDAMAGHIQASSPEQKSERLRGWASMLRALSRGVPEGK